MTMFDEVAFRNAEWIKHDGGSCPIPWAKAREFEAKGKSYLCDPAYRAKELAWKVITEYRLTDGWIPVLNGKMPKEIAEAKEFDWEFRVRSGPPQIASMSAAGYSADFWAVADVVRLIKSREVTLREYRSSNGFRKVTVTKNVILGQVFKTSVKNVKPNETEQQRLTREASTRYFEKLHAKEERVLPLGEMGIEDAIFSALCEAMKGQK